MFSIRPALELLWYMSANNLYLNVFFFQVVYVILIAVFDFAP